MSYEQKSSATLVRMIIINKKYLYIFRRNLESFEDNLNIFGGYGKLRILSKFNSLGSEGLRRCFFPKNSKIPLICKNSLKNFLKKLQRMD